MTAADPAVELVELDWCGRRVRIEHQWLGRRRTGRPLLLFLHEGLGSRSLWRDFPAALCSAGNYRGLVYSRPGYGSSTPRAAHEPLGVDFMHRQALEVLPALRQALGITEPCWLFGHSDGASIALLHAAHHPAAVAGAVLLAPHIFVEPVSVQSIRQARQAYGEGDLRQRLARHHDDVDSAFRGWNDIWLHPDFLAWNIEAELASIRCPLLAIQGIDDEYGTLEQIHRIARALPATRLLELAQCAHSAHRDQPDKVIAASVAFIDGAHPRAA
ncbi:MAG TPA: alpha/beta hydrolase [Rubrivivax sp.]|nr:alpha/beta hydrolase [Rubrivivax sp.]HPO19268.1 alpha/beta hydrolase [Rubrivivax sp.]